MPPRLAWAMAAAAIASAAPPLPLRAADPPLPTVRLSVAGATVAAELADTPEATRRGLMGRMSLSDGQGMLFVFGEPCVACMWMEGTRIPLSVAFLSSDRRIVNIETMAPLTRTRHCARFPVRWALEVPAGWFERAGVRPGDKVLGIP